MSLFLFIILLIALFATMGFAIVTLSQDKNIKKGGVIGTIVCAIILVVACFLLGQFS